MRNCLIDESVGLIFDYFGRLANQPGEYPGDRGSGPAMRVMEV